MLVPSPTQAVAVRDWLLAALLTDDTGVALAPVPFTADEVFLGERDHPRSSRFARIATITIVGRGLVREWTAADVGGGGQTLTERRSEHREWTTSITVASSLDPAAPVLSDTAGVWLRRAEGALEGLPVSSLEPVGVSFLSKGSVTDVARLTGAKRWETRCTLEVTWLCGWTATSQTGWLESVEGLGATAGSTPLPFDSREAGP